MLIQLKLRLLKSGLKNKLTKFAEENDLTISQIIRRSVKMFLDSQEAKDEE